MLGAPLAAGLPPWFMVAHRAASSSRAWPDLTGAPGREADQRRILAPVRWAAGHRPGLVRLAHRTFGNPTATPRPRCSGAGSRAARSRRSRSSDKVRNVRALGLGGPRGRVDRGLRLRDRPSRAIRTTQVPAGGAGRRRRRLVLDPGLHAPVEIAGRTYVDGGMYSLEPRPPAGCRTGPRRSASIRPPAWTRSRPRRRPTGSPPAARRLGRRLGGEAKRVGAGGAQVVLIQPTREDVETMGPKPDEPAQPAPGGFLHRRAARRRRSCASRSSARRSPGCRRASRTRWRNAPPARPRRGRRLEPVGTA